MTIRERLFDHFVGEREQVVGDREPKRLGGLEVDHQFELDRDLNGKLARLIAAQDAVRMGGSAPIIIAQVISVGQKAAASCQSGLMQCSKASSLDHRVVTAEQRSTSLNAFPP